MKIPQSTIRLLTGRLVKILLNREVSTMKSNTQNAKIEAITEKTLVLGIDVGSETHYTRAFDYRGIEYSKKPFKFSNTEDGFVTFKEYLRNGSWTSKKDMRRIRWFQVWNRPGTTGSILESFYMIMK